MLLIPARGNVPANFNANILDILTPPNQDRAAWILVGGRSSRMGRDKALAESNGRVLALRVADQALQVCGKVTLVGDPAIYAELGLPVIADRFPGKGPLAGIEAALANTSCETNLILACDMPSLGKDLLERLVAPDSESDCVLPRHDNGHVEPLCAVYQRRCHPVILAAIEAGIRKVTDALRPFAIRYIRVSDPAAFANLNTPDDWNRFHHG